MSLRGSGGFSAAIVRIAINQPQGALVFLSNLSMKAFALFCFGKRCC